MPVVLDPVIESGPGSPGRHELVPATITATRTSEEDFKQRQLIVHIDGEKSQDAALRRFRVPRCRAGAARAAGQQHARLENRGVRRRPRRADFLRGDQPRGIPDLSDADDPRRRSALCHDSPHVASAVRPQRIDDAFAGVTVTVRTAPGLPKDPAARPLIVHVKPAAFPASRVTSRSALSVDFSPGLSVW